MKIFRITFKLLALALFVSALSVPARAQALRTWVSNGGDDVNNCLRSTPCKTWAGAISKTAPGGEIDALDPSNYGTVTVTKSITLDGAETFAATSANSATGSTAGVIVNIAPGNPNDPARTVSLRRLSINGFGTGLDGIRIVQANSVFIDHLLIQNFVEEGVQVYADADVIVAVDDTQVRNCATGFKVQTSAGLALATLNNVRVETCTVGVEANVRSRVGVRDSLFMRNATGLTTTGSTGVLNIENTFVTLSQTVAVQGVTGAVIRVSSSTITQNVTGLNPNGGQIISLDHNSVFGNATDGSFTSTQPKT